MTTPDRTDTLAAGKVLERGKSIFSQNGRYELALQQDGNLVVTSRNADNTIKGSHNLVENVNTHDKSVEKMRMNANGYLDLLNFDNGVVLSYGTNVTLEKSNVVLVVQDDGNVVIYATCALWASGSHANK
jgi:hypothetical protein